MIALAINLMTTQVANAATTLCAIRQESYLVRFAIGLNENFREASGHVGFVHESARVPELNKAASTHRGNRLHDFAAGHDFIIDGRRRSCGVKPCPHAVCREAGVPEAEDDPYVRCFSGAHNRDPRQLLFDHCDNSVLVVIVSVNKDLMNAFQFSRGSVLNFECLSLRVGTDCAKEKHEHGCDASS